MTLVEQQSILTIGLLAAFADGDKSEVERGEIKRIAQSLAGDGEQAEMARLYQDVLLKRVKLPAAAAVLQDAGQRQLAYEMAVCVCDADGLQSAAERQFLADLKQQLQLGGAQTDAFEAEANAVAELAETAVPAAVGGVALVGAGKTAELATVTTSTTGATTADNAAIDQSILKYALLNGALELLPQSWASMAVIPMQVKMVYSIGKAHGVELDQGHVKEFIAAVGVGVTSQYLEQFGRKLLGGLLGKVAGKTIGNLGSAATGMAMSFATTYALGQVAKRYYAGGRVMSTALLRETFQSEITPAKQLHAQYMPQIKQQASQLDAGKVMAMLRGG